MHAVRAMSTGKRNCTHFAVTALQPPCCRNTSKVQYIIFVFACVWFIASLEDRQFGE